MSNEFLSVDLIARDGLMRLQNNLVMAGLVYRDFSNDFASVGDTVQVKKPATFTANDFTSSISAQNVTEDKALVKLDKIADVSVEVTSKELTLDVDDFGAQITEGAMQALAQKIDDDLCGLYKYANYVAGDAAQAVDDLDDIAEARKVLNDNKAPFGQRRLVVDTEADANLLTQDAIVHAEKSGTTDALREANIGKIMGFDVYMNQNIKTHTSGTLAGSGDPAIKVASEASEGSETIALDPTGTGLTGTVLAGDVLEIAGYGPVYVTENATASSNAITVKIAPALTETISAGTAVTLVQDHTANLAFHRNGLALVNRPLALPLGGADGAVVNYEGLSIRVTRGYTMSTKLNTISFDILYGVKVLEPALVVRTFGNA